MTKVLVSLVFTSLLATITSLHSLSLGIILFTTFCLYLIYIKKYRFQLISIIIIIFMIYNFIGFFNKNMRTTKLAPSEESFIIKIEKQLIVDGSLLKGEVKTVNNEKLLLSTRFKTESHKKIFLENFSYPQVCSVTGQLLEPASARNENGFDYRKYLYERNIHWLLNVKEFDFQACKSKKPTILSFLNKVRQKGIAHIDEHFPEQSAPLVAALIFGERSLMDEELLESYQRLGITHLLAISGLHVGLISTMFYYCAIRIGIQREHVMKIMLLLLPVYVILTGAAPSVIRAVAMIWLVLIAQLIKVMKIRPIDSICLAFLLFVALKPYSIFQPGFQLSFLVSFSLIVSSQQLISRYKSRVSQLFIISLISQIASLSILLYHFYEISIISVLMNIFYVPLFSLAVLPLSLLAFLFHLSSPFFAAPLVDLLTALIKFTNELSNFFSQFSFATLVIGRPTEIGMICYFIAICLFFFNFEKSPSLKSSLKSSIPLSLIIAIHLIVVTYSPYGEVSFLDVGQGDSIFIKLPFNKGTYLIDTGGQALFFKEEEWQKRKKSFDPGRDIVGSFLKSKGVRKLDKLIVTHNHLDHMGGAFYLINNFKINELVIPIVKNHNELGRNLIKEARQNNVKIRTVKSHDNWQAAKSKFYVLSPSIERYEHFSENDGSIVLYSKIGKLSWLFTGDLEEGGEHFLISDFPKLTVDVLKVGHHGSKTSTTEPFLKSVSPKISVISAGVNNRFSHPHDEVIDRLKENNVKIYRTDEDGAVTYKFFYNKIGTFSQMIP